MKQVERLQSYLQILSDINRLRIIQYISHEARTVSEIVNATELSQPLVSHHLRTLKNGGVLETKRSGPFIHYTLRDTRLLDMLGIFEVLLPGEEDQTSGDPMFICPNWWFGTESSKS